MAVSNAAPVNTRALRDANYIKNVALPNAGNTVNTNGMNLVQAVPFPMTTKVTLQVNTTASVAANSKNINIVIQDSADDSTYANIATLAVTRVAGNATAHAASSTNYALPPGTRQYVRAQATGEADGGDASNGTLTAQLLF